MTVSTMTETSGIREQTHRILEETAQPESSACCSSGKQEACCEESEKASCCGGESTAGEGCGCQ